MRKMISEEERKVLKNFAVNDNGTIVEIGGNVAFESIEQIGHMVAPEYPYELAKEKVDSGSLTVIAKGLQNNYVETNANVLDTKGPMADLNNGELAIQRVGGGVFYVGWKPLGQTQKFANVSSTQYVHFKSPQLEKIEWINERQKEFKPFFTEEQYQEILDLIG